MTYIYVMIARNNTTTFKRILATLVFLLTAASVHAIEWSGECVRVADGDTITVMYHELPLKIRLYGIDAPERGQDFGRRSRQRMADLVLHETVRVQFMGFDHYNRVIGLVSVGDRIVNQAMVEYGMAWVFKKYCKDPYLSDWLALEDEARENSVGLWSHDAPVPPWEHRQEKRKSRRTVPAQFDVNDEIIQPPVKQ
ncbi:MAG: thermonuclease family protein [Planctomycetes bacterium]|nr:thermonuclease family protein [Planctomycetota bacterium]